MSGGSHSFATGFASGLSSSANAHGAVNETLGQEVVDETHLGAHAFHEFFTTIVPDAAIVLLFLLIGLIIIGMLAIGLDFLLRKSRIPEHWRKFSVNLFILTLGLLVLFAAFGAISVNLLTLASFGVVGIALSAGFGSVISNATSGLVLQTTPALERGRVISVGGRTGRVLNQNILFTVLASKTASGESSLLRIPNSMFLSQPYDELIMEPKRGPPPSVRDLEAGATTGARPPFRPGMPSHPKSGMKQSPPPAADKLNMNDPHIQAHLARISASQPGVRQRRNGLS